MPLDVPGCTRATMIIAVSISFLTHRKRESIYAVSSLSWLVYSFKCVSLRAIKPASKVSG